MGQEIEITDLPLEIFSAIFSHLTLKDLCTLRQVDHFFSDKIYWNRLWKERFEEYFPEYLLIRLSQKENIIWFSEFGKFYKTYQCISNETKANLLQNNIKQISPFFRNKAKIFFLQAQQHLEQLRSKDVIFVFGTMGKSLAIHYLNGTKTKKQLFNTPPKFGEKDFSADQECPECVPAYGLGSENVVYCELPKAYNDCKLLGGTLFTTRAAIKTAKSVKAFIMVVDIRHIAHHAIYSLSYLIKVCEAMFFDFENISQAIVLLVYKAQSVSQILDEFQRVMRDNKRSSNEEFYTRLCNFLRLFNELNVFVLSPTSLEGRNPIIEKLKSFLPLEDDLLLKRNLNLRFNLPVSEKVKVCEKVYEVEQFWLEQLSEENTFPEENVTKPQPLKSIFNHLDCAVVGNGDKFGLVHYLIFPLLSRAALRYLEKPSLAWSMRIILNILAIVPCLLTSLIESAFLIIGSILILLVHSFREKSSLSENIEALDTFREELIYDIEAAYYSKSPVLFSVSRIIHFTFLTAISLMVHFILLPVVLLVMSPFVLIAHVCGRGECGIAQKMNTLVQTWQLSPKESPVALCDYLLSLC